jgi:hypothetical protein
MAPLGPHLSEVFGSPFDVLPGGREGGCQRCRMESAATFVRVAVARALDIQPNTLKSISV